MTSSISGTCRSRAIWYRRNGRSKMGTMGLGVCRVSGRRRVPLPPASRMALMSAGHVSKCPSTRPFGLALCRGRVRKTGRPICRKMTADIVNLPNTITLGRIFLVPLLVVVLLTKFESRSWFGVSNEVLGAAIFGIASLTDWLDGFLARRRGQVTGLGQWMDPLADKLLVTAALISLVQLGLAPAWMVAVILGREFAVTVLRSVVHARGHALPASRIGKVKLVAQVAAILLLILGNNSAAHDVAAGTPHTGQLIVLGQVAIWV